MEALSNRAADEGSTKRDRWRTVFRMVRWSMYLGAAVSLTMVFHAVPAPVIATSPQAAARVEQKVEAVEQAVSSGQSATLRLDQTEVNSYLASLLDISPSAASSPQDAKPAAGADGSIAGVPTPTGSPAEQVEQVRSSVRDVKVELLDDRLRAYVLFDFHGKDMTLQLEGKLGASNGYLRFEPTRGQIGSFPIPQSTLETAVSKMMLSPNNREKLKLPAQISDLRIENGEIAATYR
jgi:hypothetical protein